MFMLKKFSVVMMAFALVTSAAACDDKPTEPSPETVMFDAQLSPANEVPAVSNAEAGGNGTVSVTMEVTRNAAGAIASATASFSVSLTNFPAGTALTMAHIHAGAVGSNGAIVVNTGLTAGEVTLAAGSGNFTRSGIAVDAAVAQDIVNSPAGFYFNVHSVLNGSGMARGQLVRR